MFLRKVFQYDSCRGQFDSGYDLCKISSLLLEIDNARKICGRPVEQMIVLAFKVLIEEREEIRFHGDLRFAIHGRRFSGFVPISKAGMHRFADQDPEGILSELIEKGSGLDVRRIAILSAVHTEKRFLQSYP